MLQITWNVLRNQISLFQRRIVTLLYSTTCLWYPKAARSNKSNTIIYFQANDRLANVLNFNFFQFIDTVTMHFGAWNWQIPRLEPWRVVKLKSSLKTCSDELQTIKWVRLFSNLLHSTHSKQINLPCCILRRSEQTWVIGSRSYVVKY